MCNYILKLKFIIFGSQMHHEKQKSCFPVNIFGNPLYPPKMVKNLVDRLCGLILIFPFLAMFRVCVRPVFYYIVQLRDLMRLRQHPTQEAAVKAANALASSRLEYCNSLFSSLSGFNVRKLQSALVVCSTKMSIQNSYNSLQAPSEWLYLF